MTNQGIVSICWYVAFIHCNHLCIRVGNVFSHFCLCVCLCLSVCLPVQAITFWTLSHRNFIFGMQDLLTISRSSLSIKVIEQRSRSYDRNANFIYFNILILCMWLYIINKVKVTELHVGHIRVRVKISTSLHGCSYFPQAGGLHSTKMHSAFLVIMPWEEDL